MSAVQAFQVPQTECLKKSWALAANGEAVQAFQMPSSRMAN
jgi:hypothetical protein